MKRVTLSKKRTQEPSELGNAVSRLGPSWLGLRSIRQSDHPSFSVVAGPVSICKSSRRFLFVMMNQGCCISHRFPSLPSCMKPIIPSFHLVHSLTPYSTTALAVDVKHSLCTNCLDGSLLLHCHSLPFLSCWLFLKKHSAVICLH